MGGTAAETNDPLAKKTVARGGFAAIVTTTISRTQTQPMMKCRYCAAPIDHVFVDLGMRPSANRFLTAAELDEIARGKPEPKFPHKVLFCSHCGLVQLAEYRRPKEVFTPGYTYFSSYSGSWVDHARRYADMAAERFALGAASLVVEVASNDGYLLQNFVAKGIPCLGIDPARNAAEAARRKGVETIVDFFGADLARRVARERGRADLIVANNVLAHAPDINNFVSGLHALLKDDGVMTLEFPHLASLVEGIQFDTIYDEHYFYLSLGTVRTIFAHHGLAVFDVEKLPTHGGSLRVYGCRADSGGRNVAPAVAQVIAEEKARGLDRLDQHRGFQARAERIRDNFRALIAREKAAGTRIAAFGAAAKGNIFLNYCDVGADAIEFVVDDTPAKQGRFLPGSHVPVVAEDVLKERKPGLVIILPWNFAPEIKRRLDYARAWSARFVTCIPEVAVS